MVRKHRDPNSPSDDPGRNKPVGKHKGKEGYDRSSKSVVSGRHKPTSGKADPKHSTEPPPGKHRGREVTNGNGNGNGKRSSRTSGRDQRDQGSDKRDQGRGKQDKTREKGPSFDKLLKGRSSSPTSPRHGNRKLSDRISYGTKKEEGKDKDKGKDKGKDRGRGRRGKRQA